MLSGRFRTPQPMAILGRLVWEHWRQSARFVVAALAVVAVLLMGIVARWRVSEFRGYHVGFKDDPIIFFLGVLPVLACLPLLGLSAFLPDQWRNSYRFLADRGVPPKHV